MSPTRRVRRPTAAGSFYPIETESLAETVSGFLSGGKPEPGVLGLLAPHAGYVYSGAAAGAGFAALKGRKLDCAVILGTGHRVPIKGAALYQGPGLDTPLGTIPVDTGLCSELKQLSPLFEDIPRAHAEEHSIEVQLPFLQMLDKDLPVAPLLLNTADMGALEEIGGAIAKALSGKKAAIIISSDLSHYPPAAIARKADLSLLLAYEIAVNSGNMDYFRLACDLLPESGETPFDTACCGQAAMIAGAFAARGLGADSFRLLRYANSGDIPGADKENTVGYGAGVFLKTGVKKDYFALDKRLRSGLLEQARRSISAYFETNRPLSPGLSPEPVFNVPAAVFVTLHKNGNLRGCIGTLEARSGLLRAVCDYAVSSAFEDPRFPPLSEDELAQVKIEISILSPLARIKSPDEIIPGKHGVLVKKGRRGGTYLPQVWEHFKLKEDFLKSLFEEKSGIAFRAISDPDTELYTYTAAAFEEEG